MRHQRMIPNCIKPLSLAIAISTLAINGCATQSAPVNDQLPQKVLNAYQTLMGRQSYAYDMTVSIETPSATTNGTAKPTPNQDQLLQALMAEKNFNSQQRSLIEQAQHYQRLENAGIAQILGLLTKRFNMSAQGVMDLGRGQFSVVPQFNYVQNNAQAYAKLPMAADLLNSKAYVDLSGLSEIVTDPAYDGRYIAFDYGRWLKQKQIDIKPYLRIMQDMSLITPTLAKAKDYQVLPLTAADRQKGVTQKINYQLNYQESLTHYLLYFYINGKYLENTFAKMREAMPTPATTLSTLNTLSTQKPKNTEDTEAQAEQAALRVYELIDIAQQAASPVSEVDSETDDSPEAEEDADNATSTNAEEAVQTPIPDLQESDAVKQALQAFSHYRTDNYTSVKELADIITSNPQAIAKLRLAIAEQYKDIIDIDDTAIAQYGFNQRNQLVSVVSISPFPKLIKTGSTNDSKEPSSEAKSHIKSVMNIYDYGKAHVDPNIFAKAVTWQQATNAHNLLATAKKTSDFDEKDNLVTLARSLFAQNKSYVQTFETLYEYQYLLAQDEATLQTIDKTALKQTAHQLAVDSAVENDIVVSEGVEANLDLPINEDYHDTDIVDTVQSAVDSSYQDYQLRAKINAWQARGLSEALIFTQLYLYFQREDMAEYATDTSEDNVADSAAASVSMISEASDEQNACEVLLDSDQLTQASRKSLQKICDKLPAKTEPATQTNIQANDSAQNVLDQDDEAFAQLLGNIAVDDMKTQSLTNETQQRIIDQLKPLIDASYGYNSTAYQQAYQLLLQNK